MIGGEEGNEIHSFSSWISFWIYFREGKFIFGHPNCARNYSPLLINAWRKKVNTLQRQGKQNLKFILLIEAKNYIRIQRMCGTSTNHTTDDQAASRAADKRPTDRLRTNPFKYQSMIEWLSKRYARRCLLLYVFKRCFSLHSFTFQMPQPDFVVGKACTYFGVH